MKTILAIVFISLYSISFSQTFSENDLKQVAQQINYELQGIDVGAGITGRGCYAYGKTLVYLYDVTEDWYPPDNMKRDLISNIKKAGYSEIYYNNNVNIDFQYYFGNKLRKKISITFNEFSNLSFSLGDYFSTKGHPKAKDVNLKLRKPTGWKIEEGNRPNIVKKFVYNDYVYLIQIMNNFTFISRNEAIDVLNDDEFVTDVMSEASSFLREPEIINSQVVTIDKYPALEFTIRGNKERMGYNIEMVMKNWVILYEDKIVYLQFAGVDNKEFTTLVSLCDMITNSVIFPEQYNY
jgi:hypothetical protein